MEKKEKPFMRKLVAPIPVLLLALPASTLLLMLLLDTLFNALFAMLICPTSSGTAPLTALTPLTMVPWYSLIAANMAVLSMSSFLHRAKGLLLNLI